jgi:anaerobic ribonucleoside-triphosphate reductase
MSNKKLDQLIGQFENFLECWKQFNTSVNLARGKKFSADDETQFLEVKSILTQQLEVLYAAVEMATPTKDEVLQVVAAAPSLRYLAEMSEGALRAIENNWHKIYIGLHSIVGQLKVKQLHETEKPFFAGLLGGKKE